MNDLVPTIEIGKKYLYKIEPMEFQCSNCGITFGSKSAGQEKVVTVLDFSIGTASCDDCGGLNLTGEGWYSVIDEWGEWWAVPYTLLEEIKEGENAPVKLYDWY